MHEASPAGSTGGLAGGLRASAWSVTCCGLLMLVPLATGVMSLYRTTTQE